MTNSKPTLSERYAGEVLTDNTKISYFEQCRDCIYKGFELHGEFIDDYNRCCCLAYPDMKPSGIDDGSEQCDNYAKSD